MCVSPRPCFNLAAVSIVSPAAALHSRASQSARQTAAALLQYCSTGDARVLLAIQRHLCGVQDGNGDT